MSLSELTKRRSFISKLDDKRVKKRLKQSINDRKFWLLAEAIV